MYNPLPYLPGRFRKFVNYLKRNRVPYSIVFFTLGVLSTIWFLIRVVPKPSRATYPCMQATAPFMSGFVVYLLSLGGGIIAFKRFRKNILRSKYIYAFAFLVLAVSLFMISNTQLPSFTNAGEVMNFKGNFPPNDPMGEAKGIFPGRVVWMWDANATNENCNNTSNNNGYIDPGDNGWFQDFNNDQSVIDDMISKCLISLSGAADDAEAWDMIFKYYNNEHGNGNIGYSAGEKIFIKTNATTVHGDPGVRYYPDLSRNDDLSVNAFAAETNPFVVLSILRQLVNNAGVPQDMIYIGDPARNTYKSFYELWYNEFPLVNYLGNDLLHPSIDLAALGRHPVALTTVDKVFWSDNGSAMPDAVTDKLFTIFEDMDYQINIPTLKAHSAAGITLSAKNHFGSFTRTWAMHLHAGLMAEDDDPYRLGYGLYRVQTDIMMHKLLSGKDLLMMVDGLYPSDAALGVPEKWTSYPFNNDWCSSIFMSLDPVAIESVCHDFLRAEYNGTTIPTSRPNWDGVDDYLHQAADSSLWADGVLYDPDGDALLINSLGVHEHWDDNVNKLYTRNLGTGDGIELIKAHMTGGIADNPSESIQVEVFPNPATNYIKLKNTSGSFVNFQLLNISGKLIESGSLYADSEKKVSLSHYPNGAYVVHFICRNQKQSVKFLKQ